MVLLGKSGAFAPSVGENGTMRTEWLLAFGLFVVCPIVSFAVVRGILWIGGYKKEDWLGAKK